MEKFYVEFYDMTFEINSEWNLFERSFYGLLKKHCTRKVNFVINFCGTIEKNKIEKFCVGNKLTNYMGNSYYYHKISANEVLRINIDGNNGHHMIQCRGCELNIYNIDEDNKSIWCVRLCQDLILMEMLKRGFIPVHASAVEYRNKGVLVFGNKKDGKSTTMFSLVEEGCNVMSNDLVFLGRDSKCNWIIVGWPWKLTIGNALLDKTRYREYVVRNDVNDKTLFYPLEFCTVFNCQWTWVAKLDKIIHPSLDIEKKLQINTVSGVDAQKMLVDMGIEYDIISCIFTCQKLKPDYERVFSELVKNFSIINVKGDIWKNRVVLKKLIEENR